MAKQHLRWAACLLALCAAWTLAAEEAGGEQDVTIVVAGVHLQGKLVLPATEKTFQVKVDGQAMQFRWEQLEPSERRRVQKLYGIQGTDADKKTFGKPVKLTRYYLKSGKTIEGRPMPERDNAGEKALKTATLPLFYVAERDIRKTETFDGFESDYLTPTEYFDQLLADSPPGKDDTEAHLKLARTAETLELYDRALTLLEMAIKIDPRVEERNKDLRQKLVGKQAEKMMQALYDQLLRDYRAGNWVAALEKVERLERNFPSSENRSRWQALRPEIEAKTKGDQVKQVVQMAYTTADDLLQRRLASKVRVDDKGNLVVAVPGKQILTRHGKTFRGVLQNEDAQGDTVITSADGTESLRIPTADIVASQDVDLSVAAKEIERSLDDLKSYVCDVGRPDGLQGETFARIAALLKSPVARVKEIFDNRLKRDSVYKDGVVSSSTLYTSVHGALYGSGSWLRDGAKFTPADQATPAAGPAYRLRRDGNGNWVLDQQKVQVEDVSEDPDKTDDPEVWWKHQTLETKLAVLRAMMGEKVFRLKSVETLPCKQCGGEGKIKISDVAGGVQFKRCPTCRGLQALTKVNYE